MQSFVKNVLGCFTMVDFQNPWLASQKNGTCPTTTFCADRINNPFQHCRYSYQFDEILASQGMWFDQISQSDSPCSAVPWHGCVTWATSGFRWLHWLHSRCRSSQGTAGSTRASPTSTLLSLAVRDLAGHGGSMGNEWAVLNCTCAYLCFKMMENW